MNVARATDDQIRRLWVRFPPRSKKDFFLSPAFSRFLTRANAQWEIHGFTLALKHALHGEFTDLSSEHHLAIQAYKAVWYGFNQASFFLHLISRLIFLPRFSSMFLFISALVPNIPGLTFI